MRYAPDPSSALKHLVPRRIHDHPGNQLTSSLQRQRHVEHREAVREIRRAIQRIHVPAIFRCARLPAAFFGHDGVRGKVAAEPVHDQPLAGAVGLRHQIIGALEIEMPLAARVVLHGTRNQRARFAPDFHRSLKKGGHVRVRRDT